MGLQQRAADDQTAVQIKVNDQAAGFIVCQITFH